MLVVGCWWRWPTTTKCFFFHCVYKWNEMSYYYYNGGDERESPFPRHYHISHLQFHIHSLWKHNHSLSLSLSLSISPTCTYTFGFSDWLFDNWAPHTPATWCLAEWLGGPILPPAEVAVSRLTKEILVPKCRAPICVGHFFFLSHSHAIGTKAYHNFWQRARRLPISNSQDIDSSFIKVSVFAYVRTLKEKTKDTSEQERENGCFALAKVIKGFSCDVVVGRKWNANQTMFQTLKGDEEGSTIFESRNANWISFTRWQLVSIVYLPIHTYLTIYTIRSFFSTYL